MMVKVPFDGPFGSPFSWRPLLSCGRSCIWLFCGTCKPTLPRPSRFRRSKASSTMPMVTVCNSSPLWCGCAVSLQNTPLLPIPQIPPPWSFPLTCRGDASLFVLFSQAIYDSDMTAKHFEIVLPLVFGSVVAYRETSSINLFGRVNRPVLEELASQQVAQWTRKRRRQT